MHKDDIVVGYNQSNIIAVYLANPANNSFQAGIDLTIGFSDPTSIKVIDINGDYKNDIVVSTPAGFSVLMGSGTGTFGAATNISIPSGCNSKS